MDPNYSPLYDAGKNIKKDFDRLESVLHSARLGIWDWFPQTNEVIFNRDWKKMLGYQMDELSDELSTWERLVHPEDMPEISDILSKHMAGGSEFYESQHRLLHKDGHYIWILDTGQIVERDKDGNPTRVVGIHQDISRGFYLIPQVH